MRAGIRQALIDNIPQLNNCYEPNVPTKESIKPYAVVVQGQDDETNDTIGFTRSIEIWLYEKRTTFQKLDKLTEDVIKTLDLNTVLDNNNNESYTCLFEGTIGQDIIDEEWDAIARGLRFSVIALHKDEEVVTDTWIEAICNYTNLITGITTYRSYWKSNFEVPSILWRVVNSTKEQINHSLYKSNKTLRCHIVSKNKSQIESILENIEPKLISDLKIPLDIENRRYLTVESVSEDRNADMLSVGQLTVVFSRMDMVTRDYEIINKIYGSSSMR